MLSKKLLTISNQLRKQCLIVSLVVFIGCSKKQINTQITNCKDKVIVFYNTTGRDRDLLKKKQGEISIHIDLPKRDSCLVFINDKEIKTDYYDLYHQDRGYKSLSFNYHYPSKTKMYFLRLYLVNQNRCATIILDTRFPKLRIYLKSYQAIHEWYFNYTQYKIYAE